MSLWDLFTPWNIRNEQVFYSHNDSHAPFFNFKNYFPPFDSRLFFWTI